MTQAQAVSAPGILNRPPAPTAAVPAPQCQKESVFLGLGVDYLLNTCTIATARSDWKSIINEKCGKVVGYFYFGMNQSISQTKIRPNPGSCNLCLLLSIAVVLTHLWLLSCGDSIIVNFCDLRRQDICGIWCKLKVSTETNLIKKNFLQLFGCVIIVC